MYKKNRRKKTQEKRKRRFFKSDFFKKENTMKRGKSGKIKNRVVEFFFLVRCFSFFKKGEERLE